MISELVRQYPHSSLSVVTPELALIVLSVGWAWGLGWLILRENRKDNE